MPPVLFRGLIRMASWIVPQRLRAAWHARWSCGLRDWWILVERGELVRDATAQMVRTIRTAFTDALWLRFNKAYLAYCVRGPAFLLFAASCALALMAAVTGGFAVTRALIDMAAGRPAVRILSSEGPTGTLIAYTAPMVFALATGIVLAATRRLPLEHFGWRYAGFFALKTGLLMAIVSLLWIEGGTALRAHIHNAALRVLGGAIGLTLVFIAAFSYALIWGFDDQRRRCPVCLRVLSWPVTIRSWGSVFEPPITELLCEDGHGTLSMYDGQPGQMDRWTALDASWRDLFEKSRAGS